MMESRSSTVPAGTKKAYPSTARTSARPHQAALLVSPVGNCHHVGTVKGVILVAAALFLASASASAATASATAKQYGFPASWVAKERASLISSTGNHSIRCHGEVGVFMRAGGNGYKRIVCVGNDTRYTFTIDRTGHVQVAAVVA